MLPASNSTHVWAVVLAGGDGTRLQALTEMISGDARPKQFCPVFGGKSLLTHTRDRLSPAFPAERTQFVVTRAHRQFYRHELQDVDPSRILEQPMNRGTAVAIAVALLRILEHDPDAVVAIFPSDHYYSNLSAFASTIASAIYMAQQHPHSLVLLGAEAHYPEVEYGWIEPGRTMVDSRMASLQRVARFWEKPLLSKAHSLLHRGCLWNTFVTVGWAGAFLELLHATVPHLLPKVAAAITDHGLDSVYQNVRPLDLSRHVLTLNPHRLLVLRDACSGWADLGNPSRVVHTLRRDGIEPAWLRAQQPLSFAAGALLESR